MGMELIGRETIAEIARQLDKPVSYVFNVMVRSQPMQAMIAISCSLFFVVALIAGISVVRRVEDPDNRAGLAFLIFAVLVIFTLILGKALTQVLLPEYSAIMQIASMIK